MGTVVEINCNSGKLNIPGTLTQTVTHTGFGTHGTNGAKRLKSYFRSQQKWHKSPQRSGKPIQTAAHNPEVGGSSPPPATNKPLKSYDFSGFLHFFITFLSGLFFRLEFDPYADPYGKF